jgi:hypothetical protein
MDPSFIDMLLIERHYFSCIGYVASNGIVNMDDELLIVWMAAIVICFKVDLLS